MDYTLRTGSNNGVTEQTAWQGKVQLDGQKYYVVKVTLNGRSAALVQLLPANTFLLHYGVYLWLLALGTAIIWGLSFLMQHWLEWAITRPVEALQKRIEAVGGGNFTADPAVEWPNELGDIGRGINKLAADVDGLMNRRVEDEREAGAGIPDAPKRGQPSLYLQYPEQYPLDGHHPACARHR